MKLTLSKFGSPRELRASRAWLHYNLWKNCIILRSCKVNKQTWNTNVSQKQPPVTLQGTLQVHACYSEVIVKLYCMYIIMNQTSGS